MLQKILKALMAICEKMGADSEKLCSMEELAALQFDCLCGPGCPEDLGSPLVKGNNNFVVAASNTNSYAVGSTVSFTNANGDIVGTATISGAGVSSGEGEEAVVTYPVSDCTVEAADAGSVTQVKPVAAVAVKAVKAVAAKKLLTISKEAVKTETAVRN